MIAAHARPLLLAVAFLSSPALFGQLNVITSGGFAAAYQELLPEFEKSSGLAFSTKRFASQGSGPNTIPAQLRAGAAADVVIMSKEGLRELVAEGRIIPASAVDLAQARLGVAVCAGAPKPEIRTVEAFRQMLLRANSINAVSTTGLYLIQTLLPRLGIAAEVAGKIKEGTVASIASGEVELALRPVSELVSVPGVDFVGPVPEEVQYVSTFSAALVAGSKQVEAGRRLIQFLASEGAKSAIRRSGMDPVKAR